jgi:hypothetical protein
VFRFVQGVFEGVGDPLLPSSGGPAETGEALIVVRAKEDEDDVGGGSG